MEEVDNIILQALHQLGMNFPDDISTLSELPENLILVSAKKCLDVINNEDGDAMVSDETSQRIEISNEIVSQCKKLGFKGNLGYEMLLYPNEVDSRRILTFLINKLPKENEKSYMFIPRDNFSMLMQSISQKLFEELNKPWTPPYCKMRGFEVSSEGTWTKTGCRHIYPFDDMPFKSDKKSDITREFLNYWKGNVSDKLDIDIGKKSSDEESQVETIIEKLKHCTFGHDTTVKLFLEKHILHKNDFNNCIGSFNNTQNFTALSLNDITTKTKKIEKESEELVNQIKSLRIKKDEISISLNDEKLKDTKMSEQTETLSLVASLLPDYETNVEKLKKIHEKEVKKLTNLKNEVTNMEIQAEKDKNENEKHKMKHSKYTNEIKSLESKLKLLSEEYKKQKSFNLQLKKDIEKRNIKKKYLKKRSAYTKRIMEIIGNISKQKVEINKILSDTRLLQKEINNMNGRLDRSFTVVDELVFKDAKKDEHARKTYKLIAYIHTGCGDIVDKVNEIGITLREIREIEKRVETAKKKKIEENIQRVKLDLKYLQSKRKAIVIQQS